MTVYKQKSKKEILDEFENKYLKHPELRAVDASGTCEYLADNGKKCAVGQYFTNECLDIFGVYCGGVEDLVDSMTATQDKKYKTLDDLLMYEYRGHELEFWRALQALHDVSWYWKEDNGGLTVDGLDFLKQLREKYDDC